jgi:hypothetical protein
MLVIGTALEAELTAIDRRYGAVRVLWFPAAVVHLVPSRSTR